MTLIIFALTIGIIYSLVALSSIFSFRILGFPDMTPDGSLLVGASFGGIVLLNSGSMILSLMCAFCVGSVFGALTAALHNIIGISKLLSGILVMTMLYSISLRIMNTSNLSLINSATIWNSEYSEISQYLNLGIAILITGVILFILYLFLMTNIGLKIRALGDSEDTAKKIDLSIQRYNTIGLSLSNGIAGLSGGIISQYQGFVDISMGTGSVIMSLAAIIIGEILLKPKNMFSLLLCAIVGMVIYQGIITIAFRFGLPSTDMKITTVLLTIVFIFIGKIRKKTHTVDRQIGNRNI